LRPRPPAVWLAPLPPGGVGGAADDLVPDAGQILHTTSAHEHHRVLLQVVADARDVGGDFDAGTQADTRNLAQSGVRFLRGGGVDASADTTTLRRAPVSGGVGFFVLFAGGPAGPRLNCWHLLVSLSLSGWVSLARSRPQGASRVTVSVSITDAAAVRTPHRPGTSSQLKDPRGHARARTRCPLTADTLGKGTTLDCRGQTQSSADLPRHPASPGRPKVIRTSHFTGFRWTAPVVRVCW